MSEYQYYEFRAIDQPLTKQQQEELRRLSSRAEITATRFQNEYDYGDFRGSTEELMRRYFDSFLYLANWGTRQLVFRLPKEALDRPTAEQYCHHENASVTATRDHVIISLDLNREEADDDWLEGEGLLDELLPLRDALAEGDLRLLYLAWLSGIRQADDYDDDPEDELEPPVPAGLNQLGDALRTVIDFLEMDKDLIAVAAQASPPLQKQKPVAFCDRARRRPPPPAPRTLRPPERDRPVRPPRRPHRATHPSLTSIQRRLYHAKIPK